MFFRPLVLIGGKDNIASSSVSTGGHDFADSFMAELGVGAEEDFEGDRRPQGAAVDIGADERK